MEEATARARYMERPLPRPTEATRASERGWKPGMEERAERDNKLQESGSGKAGGRGSREGGGAGEEGGAGEGGRVGRKEPCRRKGGGGESVTFILFE